ncbi:MAG: DUF4215 domain-containing protein, partial [Myxococcales bacterium]|nr:DUF4215 domain-containing protein [Myxococcales bacterium]
MKARLSLVSILFLVIGCSGGETTSNTGGSAGSTGGESMSTSASATATTSGGSATATTTDSGGSNSNSNSNSGTATDSSTSAAATVTATATDSSGGETTGTTGPAPFCGDQYIDPGEECDDGNQVDDDDCSNAC